MGPESPGVHHPFGDALVVEVSDLLPQIEVLKEHRTAVTCLN